MKSFQDFNESAEIYRKGKKEHSQSLEAKRQEALRKSKEQLARSSKKPERAKPKPVASTPIKQKKPRIDVAKAVVNTIKHFAKKRK